MTKCGAWNGVNRCFGMLVARGGLGLWVGLKIVLLHIALIPLTSWVIVPIMAINWINNKLDDLEGLD